MIVLTADATIEAKNRALAAVANDFLTKPFEHTEDLLRVNNLLRTRALHEQMLPFDSTSVQQAISQIFF